MTTRVLFDAAARESDLGMPQRVVEALNHMPKPRAVIEPEAGFAHWSLAAQHARLSGCSL